MRGGGGGGAREGGAQIGDFLRSGVSAVLKECYMTRVLPASPSFVLSAEGPDRLTTARTHANTTEWLLACMTIVGTSRSLNTAFKLG